jgi:hypothetical protein
VPLIALAINGDEAHILELRRQRLVFVKQTNLRYFSTLQLRF